MVTRSRPLLTIRAVHAQSDAAQLSGGTLLAVPAMNPPACETQTSFTKLDDWSIDEAFPVASAGILAWARGWAAATRIGSGPARNPGGRGHRPPLGHAQNCRELRKRRERQPERNGTEHLWSCRARSVSSRCIKRHRPRPCWLISRACECAGDHATIRWCGTSMATPHVVAGAAALFIAGHPGATFLDVRNGLQLVAGVRHRHLQPMGVPGRRVPC